MRLIELIAEATQTELVGFIFESIQQDWKPSAAPGWPRLYHGSEKHFTQYDMSMGREDSFIYASPDIDVARSYGPYIYLVEPTEPPRIIDISKKGPRMVQELTQFLEEEPRYGSKWSPEDFLDVVLEGRMFVKDEYGELQNDLLDFLFLSGYNCVILADVTYDSDNRSWVFEHAWDLVFTQLNEPSNAYFAGKGIRENDEITSPPPARGPITSDQAAWLIANDDELFNTIVTYVADYPDIFEEDHEQKAKMVNILKRIKPFVPYSDELYRGEPEYSPSTERNRGFSSWSSNTDTAQNFAQDYRSGVVRATVGPIKAVSLNQIITQRMRVRDESHYGGMQAEWFVLNDPLKTKIIGDGRLIYKA